MRTHRDDEQRQQSSAWHVLRLVMGVLAACLLYSTPGQTAMRPIEVAELAKQAKAIVIGTVLQQDSAWDEKHTTIHTDIVLDVERVLAGTPGQRVTLRVEGGIVGSMGMRTSNDATFTKGERVLVFLDTDQVPNRLVGLQQGKFTLQDQQAIRADETWSLDTLLGLIQEVAH